MVQITPGKLVMPKNLTITSREFGEIKVNDDVVGRITATIEGKYGGIEFFWVEWQFKTEGWPCVFSDKYQPGDPRIALVGKKQRKQK